MSVDRLKTRNEPFYEPPRVLAVDVDGTLFVKGRVNRLVVDFVMSQKTAGFEIIIWSSRGTDYAKRATAAAGLTGVADVVTSKPGAIIDDQGWQWIKYTRVIAFDALRRFAGLRET